MQTRILSINDPLWKDILRNIHHDIYQLPEYLLLEAVRQEKHPEAILIEEGEKIFLCPYLIFQCEGIGNSGGLSAEKIFEIQSPYGYPGILLNQSAANSPEFIEFAIKEFKHVLRQKNVCSAFLRMHPILNDNLAEVFPSEILTANGETISVDLSIDTASIWSHTKGSIRNKINKAKRHGFTANMVKFDEYIGEYANIYEETMERVTAKINYFDFDREYCMQLRSALGEKLHLCVVEFDGEVASAGLYTELNGIVQSIFGGTRNKFVKMSPSALELDYARYWFKERGNKFMHLGGGLGGSTEDKLYAFKASFSKLSHRFFTLRLIVCDDTYYQLVNIKANALGCNPDKLLKSGFFPAYRAC